MRIWQVTCMPTSAAGGCWTTSWTLVRRIMSLSATLATLRACESLLYVCCCCGCCCCLAVKNADCALQCCRTRHAESCSPACWPAAHSLKVGVLSALPQAGLTLLSSCVVLHVCLYRCFAVHHSMFHSLHSKSHTLRCRLPAGACCTEPRCAVLPGTPAGWMTPQNDCPDSVSTCVTKQGGHCCRAGACCTEACCAVLSGTPAGWTTPLGTAQIRSALA